MMRTLLASLIGFLTAFSLAGITAAGYGGSGRAVSVDISNPEVGSGSW